MAIRTVSNYLRLSQRQHYIIDTLAYHAKNLYNVALYNTRQHSFEYCENISVLQTIRPDIASKVTICVGSFLPYTRKKDFPYKDISNYARSRQNENYPLLHSDVAQQTLRSVEEAYSSYFALMRMYHSGDLPHRPRLPRYLEKDGRYKMAFPASHITIRNGNVTLGMARMFKKQHGLTGKELTFKIPPHIQPNQIREVTIVPVHNGKVYKIEFAYTVSVQPTFFHPDHYLAIDLGVNNFATIVETATGTASIIDGMYLKSINRWYNKENARLQSIKDKQGLTKDFTHSQSRLLIRRDNRINETMNRIVAYLIAFACEHGIGTIIVPRWDGIKHQINHGAINNQNFVQIPYAEFRQKLRSKCELVGIQYDDSHDERYTSQVDALARDPIEKPWYGRTRRITRGLYQSSSGTVINADVNGALNHLRKVAGDSVITPIISSGRVNRPVRIRLNYEQPSCRLNCTISRMTGIASPAV
ncbi:IS605 OrfB family transposase [Methanocalculus alkaliphilus]|uniref:RNA-guided endonuclease InsQ/TnpB family protein n=1 Tax=Methanocalculus alkaliphilus TaxID=768730 RepID=UPI00209E62B6|nr:transposase [Methanocalculus alkaliphilus]MCP1715266.1 IS605 OrfB family transposase [Methanocalculus alkaliphilus]